MQASQSEESGNFKYFPSLEGLRGIAVLVVMFHHMETRIFSVCDKFRGGFLGVDTFFVLSGFLITSILLSEREKTGKISLKNFYLRRGVRLVPAFWVYLLVVYFAGEYFLTKENFLLTTDSYNYISAIAYLTNWYNITGTPTALLSHIWSLAVEEQFYIIWSSVLYLAYKEKKNNRQILKFTLGLIGVLIIIRAGRAFAGTEFEVLYFSTDSRMDGLLIGCVTAFVFKWKLISEEFYKTKNFSHYATLCLCLSVMIFLVFAREDLALYYGGFSIFSLCVAVMILWLVKRSGTFVHRILEFRPLIWIGQVSYGLYLWHNVMFDFSRKTFVSAEAKILFGFALTFIVCAASFYLIEKPFLKIKHKF
jgi:peptidoglycan/LPS O-acetylase OafA/YrhL